MIKQLTVLFIFLLASISFAFAQDADTVIQQFLEQRKKMMEEIMKAFDDDDFFKGDAIDDKMFDQLRKHGLGGFHGFSSTGNNVKVEERAEKDGSISIVITPKNKDMKLDIKTTKEQIVIHSEMMEKVENESKQGKSQSYSRSSFSQTIPIPTGFEAQKPKQEGESIVIALVPTEKSNFKPDSKGRMPIQKGYEEETI